MTLKHDVRLNLEQLRWIVCKSVADREGKCQKFIDLSRYLAR